MTYDQPRREKGAARMEMEARSRLGCEMLMHDWWGRLEKISPILRRVLRTEAIETEEEMQAVLLTLKTVLAKQELDSICDQQDVFDEVESKETPL